VVEGLRTFRPGPEHNPGRMNVYSVGEVTVVVDLAHNEAGLEALMEIMAGLRRPGGRLLLGLGTAGDRTDDLLRALGEIAGRDADQVAIVHKSEYLRGRDRDELAGLLREGAAHVGMDGIPAYDSELDGLVALMGQAAPGDVVAVMCHQDRPRLDAWVRDQGGSVDDPETLSAKVRAAQP
jgi:cyanophycin synthetase